MVEDGYESLYLRNQEAFDRLYTKRVDNIYNRSTMKTFVLSYSIGAYVYESDVRTSSSQAAMLWAEALGAKNIRVIREE
jgi:hypothetical protein